MKQIDALYIALLGCFTDHLMSEAIYLNDIYEHFGIKWDPHEHNECFIKGSNSFELLWEYLKDNAFKINIYSV